MKTRDSMVLVARPELTPALRERLSFDPSVLVFSSGDAANALSMIVNRNLPIVTLDRFFVSTPGGAKFVADLQTLNPDSQIRILEDEGSSVPLVLRRPPLRTDRTRLPPFRGRCAASCGARRGTRCPPGTRRSWTACPPRS